MGRTMPQVSSNRRETYGTAGWWPEAQVRSRRLGEDLAKTWRRLGEDLASISVCVNATSTNKSATQSHQVRLAFSESPSAQEPSRRLGKRMRMRNAYAYAYAYA
jgi:hypothetical protein